MKEFYTVGEISKIYDVSTDTLRYYDKIGLLKPWHTGTNGYRYYSKAQFETISTIMLLRSMGTPITDLVKAINSSSPAGITEALDNYVLQVDEKIRCLKLLKDEAVTLRHNINDVLDNEEIRIAEIPGLWMFSKTFGDKDELDIESILLVNRLAHKSWTTHAAIISTITPDNLLAGNFHTYDRYGYLSETPVEVRSDYLTVIPARRCVVCNTCVHSVEHSEMDDAYRRCLAYISHNGLHISGDAIESNVLSLYSGDPFNPKMFFRIYIPVEN